MNKKKRIQDINENYNILICAQTDNCQPKNYTTLSQKKDYIYKIKNRFYKQK